MRAIDVIGLLDKIVSIDGDQPGLVLQIDDEYSGHVVVHRWYGPAASDTLTIRMDEKAWLTIAQAPPQRWLMGTEPPAAWRAHAETDRDRGRAEVGGG